MAKKTKAATGPTILPEKPWPLDKIIPYPKNARTHPPAQITLLATLLKRWGPDQAIVVDERGVILKGHGRRLASIEAGLKIFPVVQRLGMPEAEKEAMRIADNQVALLAGWDQELMKVGIESLQLSGYDMNILGFEPYQLAEFLTPGIVGEVDPDIVPPIPKKPVVRKGDLWVLGDEKSGHRLLCGDSTKAEDVSRLMSGAKARLMNTDPPYGIGYDSSAIHAHGVDYGEIESDDILDSEKLQAFLESSIRTAVLHLTDDAAFYLWHPMLTQGTFFAAAAAAADILIHRQIIWIKPVLVFGRGDYHWKHELCFYGWRRGHRPKFYGERNQTTVWEIDSISHLERKELAHATPKPVELFVRPINNHTKSKDICYEPFAGTGPQVIAAEMTGRRCYAVEIAPQYVETCILRWQTFTGKLATLDGKTLEQVAKARRSGRAKGKPDEAGHSRVPIQSTNGARDGKKHQVRKGGDAGLPAAERKPARQPPALPADS